MIPMSAALGAGAGAATSLAAQRALWSAGAGGRYLTQGLFPGMNPLIGQAGRGALGLGGAVSPLLSNAQQ